MGSPVGCVTALLSLAALVLVSPPVRAAPPSKPDPNTQAVEDYFDEGHAAASANRFDDALRAFRSAWAIEQRPTIACNIGRLEFRQKNFPAAAEFLTYCTASAENAEDERAHAQEVAELKQALADVGTLHVEVADPRAEIVIGDQVVGRGGAPATFFVSPGEHTVKARLDGHQTEATINVERGGSRTVTLTLEPAQPIPRTNTPPAAPATDTTKSSTQPATPVASPAKTEPLAAKVGAAVAPVSTAGAPGRLSSTATILWTGGTTAAASLGTAIGFMVAAENKREEVQRMAPAIAQRNLANACADGDTRGGCREYNDGRTAWEAYNRIAIASFVVGGAALATTGTLLIASRVRVKPAMAVGGLGVIGSW